MWISRVQFNFMKMYDMLDKLSPLLAHIIGQMRYWRVWKFSHYLTLKRDPINTRTNRVLLWANDAVNLPRGLNSHVLTIVFVATNRHKNDMITDLFQHSHGWKETEL